MTGALFVSKYAKHSSHSSSLLTQTEETICLICFYKMIEQIKDFIMIPFFFSS